MIGEILQRVYQMIIILERKMHLSKVCDGNNASYYSESMD